MQFLTRWPGGLARCWAVTLAVSARAWGQSWTPTHRAQAAVRVHHALLMFLINSLTQYCTIRTRELIKPVLQTPNTTLQLCGELR